MTLSKFLDRYTEEQKLQSIFDYRALEQTGATGNSTLRQMARDYLDHLGTHTSSHILIHMECIVKECYRYFAEKWIEENYPQVCEA